MKGKAFKFGDNISTDHIAPGRLYHLRSDLNEFAKHVLEDADETFASRMKKGDFVVAGNNFGLGSSREHEPQIIKIMDLEALSNIWPDLDPRSQYVLEARYLLEKSTDEIASELNIKPDSVRMAISRARKKAYMLMTK